jgi:PPM family protein phosphatase
MRKPLEGVEVHAAFFTHKAGRADNQDACLCGDLHAGVSMDAPREAFFPAGEPWTIALADGMGGYRGGAFAARFILEKVARRRPADATGWSERLREIHQRLRATAAASPEVAGCGATVAGIAAHPAGVALFNVGDARVYRRAGDALVLLTHDDRFHEPGPLLQALGGPAHLVEIDPHVRTLPFVEARLLLCTDGLSDTLALEEIERQVCSGKPRAEIVAALAQDAVHAHCADNLTVVVADLVRVAGQFSAE